MRDVRIRLDRSPEFQTIHCTTSVAIEALEDAGGKALQYVLQDALRQIAYEVTPQVQEVVMREMRDREFVREVIREASVAVLRELILEELKDG